jgi:alpha-glucosidase (family GH31 glycosyl hydrolase)
MRPLWFEFPDNPLTFAAEDEFLLGPGLLVKPVSAPGVDHADTLLPK